MPWTSKHIDWLVDTKEKLQTSDGKTVEVWEFRHGGDEEILSAWATHFRNHYCLDTEVDELREGPGLSRADYLTQMKFPDQSAKPGPSIRAGDFGEILVADCLEFVLNYTYVPRTRYSNKSIPNESTKGSDVIGFKLLKDDADSAGDLLAIIETKTQFSVTKPRPRLQHAIDDSVKDEVRKAESLNAIRQRLLDKQLKDKAEIVKRFQDPEDRPYTDIYGAAALVSLSVYEDELITGATAAEHPQSEKLMLLVIKGERMMELVHDLYRRAADEA
jgi:uncharacterized protein DUF1837